MLGQDLNLVEERPEADSLLSNSAISSVLLTVPQEGAKVAGATVICQNHQQTRAELKGAGELGVDLEDAVKEQQENWTNKILAFSNVGTIPSRVGPAVADPCGSCG